VEALGDLLFVGTSIVATAPIESMPVMPLRPVRVYFRAWVRVDDGVGVEYSPPVGTVRCDVVVARVLAQGCYLLEPLLVGLGSETL
jgi:hypothetical protein